MKRGIDRGDIPIVIRDESYRADVIDKTSIQTSYRSHMGILSIVATGLQPSR